MVKKLLNNGNSKCVIIPKSFLKMMNVDLDNGLVKFGFDGEKITIEKHEESEKEDKGA